MLQLAVAHGCRSNYKRAISHSFGDALVLFRVREQCRSADSGTRLAKRRFVRVHHSQTLEAEVAHGASSRAYVQGVARSDEHDAQLAELGGSRQEQPILCHATNFSPRIGSREQSTASQFEFGSE